MSRDDDDLAHSARPCGPYGVVQTPVAGVHFSELMPMTAGLMDRCAVIRSLTHKNSGHVPVPMMTGFDDKMTSHGAVVAKLKGALGGMPPYVHLGSKLNVGGGALGSAFDPLEVPDPSGRRSPLPDLALSQHVPAARFQDRRELLRAFDATRAAVHQSRDVERMDEAHRRAADLLTSGRVRAAFDLSRENPRLVERYDTSRFKTGLKRYRPSTLGKQLLLARRLCEAGCGFITIHNPGWDMHGGPTQLNMQRGMEELGRPVDHAVATFLGDVHQRGLSEKILLIITGEFGRTPAVETNGRINVQNGRDHNHLGFTYLLAGGGIKGGLAYGTTDEFGFVAEENPVHLHDLHATVLHQLGLNHERLTYRYSGRDMRLTDVAGRVVKDILA